ncbi:unnamed protein product [Rodentolepis nana]|uniref:RING-type domain-containing protein n=1 Tax=Rodentolepis nana TaxID=102285 RepID=A0A0R3TPA8_RODNA|nr:unnamed protein product [Rodentolepis nana]
MEQTVCVICQQNVTPPVGQPDCCKHKYCFSCLENWVGVNSSCPQDRKWIMKILISSRIGGPIVAEMPIRHISRRFRDYRGWSETFVYDPESIYGYIALNTPYYPFSFSSIYVSISAFYPYPSSRRRLHSTYISRPMLDDEACEGEIHLNNGFGMTELFSTESIGGLEEVGIVDANNTFYHELSSADWFHRLANLLAHIWEELDSNARAYGEIMPCGAQNGEIISNFLWLYIRDVQVLKNITAEVAKTRAVWSPLHEKNIGGALELSKNASPHLLKRVKRQVHLQISPYAFTIKPSKIIGFET